MISPNKNDLIAKIWQRLAYYDTSLIFPMRNRLQTVSAHNGSWTKLVFINLIKVCIVLRIYSIKFTQLALLIAAFSPDSTYLHVRFEFKAVSFDSCQIKSVKLQ